MSHLVELIEDCLHYLFLHLTKWELANLRQTSHTMRDRVDFYVQTQLTRLDFTDLPDYHAVANHSENLRNLGVNNQLLEDSLKLEVLHLQCFLTVQLVDLVNNLHSLKSLEFTDCTFNDEWLWNIVEQCPLLHTVQFIGCKITQNSLKTMTELKMLSCLNVSRCSSVNDEGICEVAMNCSQLQHLKVRGCQKITDQSVICIAKHTKQLQSLDISFNDNITDAAVCKLAASCRQLEQLNISKCKRLTDRSIKCIAQNLKALESLNIGWCNSITDHALCEVSTNCHELGQIYLSGCKLITNISIKSFANSCVLKSINIGWCGIIKDDTIREIARKCPAIRNLDVSGCKILSDDSIKCVAKHCGMLTHLKIGWNDILTDSAVHEILVRCEKLRHLDASGCQQLSDTVTKSAAKHGTMLTHFDVCWCPRITSLAVQELKFTRPSLNVLWLDV